MKTFNICFTQTNLTRWDVIGTHKVKIASSLKQASLGWAVWLEWLLLWVECSGVLLTVILLQGEIEISWPALPALVSPWFVDDICSSGASVVAVPLHCLNIKYVQIWLCHGAVARCRAQNDPISVIRKPAEVLFVFPTHKYSVSGAKWCYHCKLLSEQ